MSENQELDSMTKLQLVQPLSFGDMVFWYLRKFRCLILACYCRYRRFDKNENRIDLCPKSPSFF